METTKTETGPVTSTTEPCGKCKAPVSPWNTVACFDCTRVYARCGMCGGQAGARRSLHSHRALHRPAVSR